MVNILLIPLAKVVINLVGRQKIEEVLDKGIDFTCDFLEKKGFPKAVCRPLANTIKKVLI